MRVAPDWFVRQLNQEHDGRLRARWSPARFRWAIEQQVERKKAFAPHKIDEFDDDAIRANDGYSLVLEVSPGTRTPCTNAGPDGKMCGHELKAPHGRFVQAKCPACVRNGFHGGVTLGHFDLNDQLLQHLRRIDPNRGGFERARQSLDHSRRLKDLKEAALFRESRAAAVDDMRVDIAKRGYSGKETMWIDAPSAKY